MSLFLGKKTVDETPVELPVKVLQRHFICLGASGSGKTVLCKCVMEEAVRNGIPLIIVDPQGDIASLALRGDPIQIEEHGTPLTVQEEFFEKARVAIFTPASSKGIPISVNPLKFPSEETPDEEAILAIDMTATSLTSFLGYDLDSDAGKGAKAYLFMILEHLWRNGRVVRDMGHMADLVLKPPAKIAGVVWDLVTKKEPAEIARKLRYLTVGTPSLMFEMGVQIDVDMFMDRSDGRVPVNIIYLNTLASGNDKEFFLATLLREVYCWMLKNPSEDVQMLLYVDEIAPFIPPYPRNPPPKEAYAFLFKQARKYGIGLVAATQNVTDIDYKALAQVNTWCLGRLMTTQDLARVQKIIQSVDPLRAEMVLERLPSLQTCEFLMLSPDAFDDVVDFQVRWLVSKHLTLDERDVPEALAPESRSFFERYLLRQKEAVEKPAVPTLPSKPLDERIRLLLYSTRRSVSAESIAGKLRVPVEEVEVELERLVKDRVVERGQTKEGVEDLYWLRKFGFSPSKEILGEVLTIPVRVTQVRALKIVKSMLEGGLFGKREEVYEAEFSHVPIWRVTATYQVKRFFFMRKEETALYYLSARTGAMLSLEKKSIVFHKVMRETARKLKDLDDDEDITFVPKVPNEIGKMPRIKVGRDEACRTVQLSLGASPVSAEIVLLPVWTLRVRHKKTGKKRTLIVDAASGRTLSGTF